MALIKQRRQFLPQNIGVVRPDTGDEFVTRGAERLADSLITGSFDLLKREAKQRGVDLAQAASDSSLRTINPETGRPEAFEAPPEFGVAAQDAYNDIINRRYINLTEADFKAKAEEIYQKHRFDDEGSAKFAKEFGDFVDETAANASPKFSNIINNVGTTLLASNKLNMQSKEAERKRTNLASSSQADFENKLGILQDLIAISAPQIDIDEAKADIESILTSQSKAFPEIFTPEVLNRNRNTFRTTVVTGAAQNIVSKALTLPAEDLTSDTINNIEQALLSPKNQELQDAVPESIRPLIQDIVKLEGFGTNKAAVIRSLDALRQNLQVGEVNEAQRKRAERDEIQDTAASDAIAFVSELGEEEKVIANKIQDAIADGNLGEVASLIKDLDKKIDEARPTFLSGNKSTRPLDAAQIAIRTFTIRSLIADASDQLDADGSEDLHLFLTTGGNKGGSSLPPAVMDIARTVVGLQDTAQDFTIVRSEADRVLRENAPTTPTALDRAFASLTSNQVVDGGDAKVREAGDVYVWRSLNVAPENQQPAFYLSSSAFQENGLPAAPITGLMSRRVVPEGMGDALSALASGVGLNDEAYVNGLNMFRSFYRMPTADGTFLTLWSNPGGLSPDEQSVFQTVLALQRLQPERNVKETFFQVIERKQNPDTTEANIMVALSGYPPNSELKTGRGMMSKYLAFKAGGNRLGRELFEPLIVSMANNNFTFKQIDKEIDRLKESIFAPTDGLVVDRLSGFSGSSPYSLRAVFPDEEIRSLFVSKVQRVLDEQTDGQFVFSAVAGKNPGKFGLEDKNMVVLVPFPNLSLKPNDKNRLMYFPMYKNEANELVPIIGKDGPLLIPLELANQEIQNLVTRREEEAIARGAASDKAKKRRRRQSQTPKEILPSMDDGGA